MNLYSFITLKSVGNHYTSAVLQLCSKTRRFVPEDPISHLGWRLGVRPKPAGLFPSGLAIRVATQTCRPVSIWAGG